MINEEILDTLRRLNRTEKLEALQVLAYELAQEEKVALPNMDFPIWSPYDSYEAAETLRKFMEPAH
ncbi:MAG: hypothetical protein LCI00_14965 [Chloroflexi bacterium]|nr:hypothetical protein [Chloroflexota bacterium]MCC6892598.1 hypothetical protein [Anaerolineae bacterium]